MKIVGVIGGVAGSVVMIIAGVGMMSIESKGAAEGLGRTIDEVFYNAMGLAVVGLGVFCIMLIGIVSSREARLAAVEGDEDEVEGAAEEECEEEEHQDQKQASSKRRFVDVLDRLTRD